VAASVRSRRTPLLALAALLALSTEARAVPDPQPTTRVWVTDNWARTIAADQGQVYVGGHFKIIAPYTGGGGVVDLVRGELATIPDAVDGAVYAVVSDGGGGWFIGGEFRAVGGVPRRCLAHVDGAGHVLDWTADVAGAVSCLAIESGRLFVGGYFSSIGGVARQGLAALDPRTGAVLAWDAHIEGQVLAIARQGRSLYLGGRFLAVGGESRTHLAAVDVSSGVLLSWNPGASGDVYALAVTSGSVLVAGDSMTIGGASRTGLAAIDARTGALLPWNPRLSATDLPPYVRSLAIRGSTLYFAGFLDRVNDVPIRSVAAVDLQTAALSSSWNPRPDGSVVRIAVRGTAVYLGGDFSHVGDVIRNNVAAVDAADAHVLEWDPEAIGGVNAISFQGNTAYVGGSFEGLGGRARIGAASIDAASSRITDWQVTNLPWWNASVEGIAVGNGRVFAANSLNFVGGLYVLAWAIDAHSGAYIPEWIVYGNGTAPLLALQGNSLYLGGDFDQIDYVPRHGLAAVDAVQPALLAWDPAPYRDERFPPLIHALVPRGSDVYVGGFFAELGGSPRPLLGAVDAITGRSTDWVPASGHWGRAIAVNDDRVFTAMPGHISALDAATGASLWETETNSSALALATGNGLLFAAGTFTEVGGEPRKWLAALDPANGRVLDWNPDVNRVAAQLVVSENRLFGVGAFGVYSIELSDGVGSRRAAARTTPAQPASLTQCMPVTAGEARVTLAMPESGPVTIDVFDLQGRHIRTVLDHAWLEAGTHEQSIRTSDWPRGLYFVRVDLAGRTESHRIAVIR